MTTAAIYRGDIFTVDLEPVQGSERGKRRPAVVIQNNVGNRHSPLVIVAAITSGRYARYPVNVELKAPEGGLKNNSLVLLNQIRSVDKSRLGHRWGQLSAETMRQVDQALKISLALD